MNNNEIFIEKYKLLEEVIRKEYQLKEGNSPIAFIEKRKEYSNIATKLSYCREVRNFLQHEPKINTEFAIIASDEMIKLIDQIIDLIKNPLKCYNISIKLEQIYHRRFDDKVLESIKCMDYLNYSHIPLLENKVLKGVFSKTSLFDYMLKEKKFSLDDNLRFCDINEYVSINGNNSESYQFARNDEKVENIKKIFEENYQKAQRVAIIFLTKNGHRDEDIIGMITPYDVIK